MRIPERCQPRAGLDYERSLPAHEALRPGLGLSLAIVGYAALAAFGVLHHDDRAVGHGAAVFAALQQWQTIATLDLRIDYLRGGDAGRDIICRANCYRITRNVAFTRAVAYHDDETDLIATSAGTFMLGTKAAGAKK